MTLLHKEELNDDEGIYLRVEVNLDNDWIYLDWLGLQDEIRIKTGLNYVVDLLKKYEVRKLLNNNNNHHGPYPQMIYDWIEQDWLPRARENGLKLTATILSPKVFSRMSALHMGNRFKTNNYKNFDDEQEAIDWLNNTKF